MILHIPTYNLISKIFFTSKSNHACQKSIWTSKKNDCGKYVRTPKFKDLWILGPFSCWLVCVVDFGSAIGQAPDLKVVSLA